MKKQVLFTLLAMLVSVSAFSFDIKVANADGVTIYYNWENNKTKLYVTYGGDPYTSYSNEYSGKVVIPETVTFEGNTYPVTRIGYQAFYGCKGITSFVIPNSVTSIGIDAFKGCTGLTSVVIPNSVTSIESGAFGGCTGLTSVVIPNSVTSIGGGAFSGCTGLTSIEIPNSLTSIGIDAFLNTAWYNNQPDGVFYIGKMAYTYKGTMPENTTIVLKEGTTGIADNAFYNCKGLTSIEIPNSVTSIGGSAFYGCSGLTSIDIPNSVTRIGQDVFYNCKGLTSIEIPNSVTSIGGSAFYGCSGLTSIDIPNSVTSIGGNAFKGCTGLTSVVIPNSVTSIDYSAFMDCVRLSRIDILAINPPLINDGYSSAYLPFGISKGYNADAMENYHYTYVHIPKGTYEAYSSAYGWRYFERFVEDLTINGTPYYVKLNVNEANKGYVEQYVKINDTYTVSFGKKNRAPIKSVKFNDEDVTEDVKNNTYTTPKLVEDSMITIEYNESDSDINNDGIVDTQDVLEIYKYMQEH